MLPKATAVHATTRRAGNALCQVLDLKNGGSSSVQEDTAQRVASSSGNSSHVVFSRAASSSGAGVSGRSHGVQPARSLALSSSPHFTTPTLSRVSSRYNSSIASERPLHLDQTQLQIEREPVRTKTWIERFTEVTQLHSYHASLQLVDLFRTNAKNPSVREYNAAIGTLAKSRVSANNDILIVYNEMVTRGLQPDANTYALMIRVMASRERDVQLKQRAISAYGRDFIPGANMEDKTAVRAQENNFNSAMKLFDALNAVTLNATRGQIRVVVYTMLLEMCAYTGNVEAAIHVFALLEQRKDVHPTADIFTHLITVYAKANDLEGAKEVFEEYMRARKERRVADKAANDAINDHLGTWNTMIETYFICKEPSGALALVEHMMDGANRRQSSPSSVSHMSTPAPGPKTFQIIIEGFCNLGQMNTALTWFNRLCEQRKPPGPTFAPSLTPTRPSQQTWDAMVEHTAKMGMVDEMNRIVRKMHMSPDLIVKWVTTLPVLKATFDHLATHEHTDAEGIARLDFLVQFALDLETNNGVSSRGFIVEKIASGYLSFRASGKAITLFDHYVRSSRDYAAKRTTSRLLSRTMLDQLVPTCATLVPKLLHRKPDAPAPTWKEVLLLTRVVDSVDVSDELYSDVQAAYLQAYVDAKAAGTEFDLEPRDYEILIWAAVKRPHTADEANGMDLYTILKDVLRFPRHIQSFYRPEDMQRLAKTIVLRIEGQQLEEIMRLVPPHFAAVLGAAPDYSLAGLDLPDSQGAAIRPNLLHTRLVDALLFPGNKFDPELAYTRFNEGAKLGLYPVIGTVGRLIEALGRAHQPEKARELYASAQRMIGSMPAHQRPQSLAWFEVENRMASALAHAGDYPAAAIHHKRIIAQSGRPTANTYGSLIYAVLERENDTTLAFALFKEARRLGVRLTAYIYTNLISKQARAKKPEQAAAAFEEMKKLNVTPGPVTYTALILAYANVGDAANAELMFAEMLAAGLTHRHRAESPYHIMMQMYSTLQPNRERALHYHEALKTAGIPFTAHTYKLLLDTHSAIAPVNMDATLEVFRSIEANKDVSIDGSHWASLIRGWGCFSQDFDQALDVFKSIASHPSTENLTRRSLGYAYDAILEVIVAHKRMDMVDWFLQVQNSKGIPLSSYGATLLVKGYGDVGDLEQARVTFEALNDVAYELTPENHILRKVAPDVEPTAPIYRRASTWDAMIRAELIAGNRAEAVELVSRLEQRKFPADLVKSIKALLKAESVTSWSPDHWSATEFESGTSADDDAAGSLTVEDDVNVGEEGVSSEMQISKTPSICQTTVKPMTETTEPSGGGVSEVVEVPETATTVPTSEVKPIPENPEASVDEVSKVPEAVVEELGKVDSPEATPSTNEVKPLETDAETPPPKVDEVDESKRSS